MKNSRHATHGDPYDFITSAGGRFEDFHRAESTAMDLLRGGVDSDQITVIVNDEARLRVLDPRPELADLQEDRFSTSVELHKEREALDGAGAGAGREAHRNRRRRKGRGTRFLTREGGSRNPDGTAIHRDGHGRWIGGRFQRGCSSQWGRTCARAAAGEGLGSGRHHNRERAVSSRRGLFKRIACGAVGLVLGCGGAAPAGESEALEALVSDYIERWKEFHPRQAARMGLVEYRDREEDRSPSAIQGWVAFNDSVLASTASLRTSLPLDLRIDLSLIRSRGRAERARWSEGEVSSREGPSFRLGRDAFQRELERYYDVPLTPEEVAEAALEEIQEVKELMAETARRHWVETRGGEDPPGDEGRLIAWALAEMEENRPSSQQESLDLFTRFAWEAEAFVRDQGIATLPPDRTLEIVLTPPSAGPAQRIGFVDPAPPFDRQAMTVLSLPTIEDTFPEAEKEDFYRSFNNHFNKAIIVHELFPGHYMQGKIASTHPREARIFFPYEPYVEGWATLVERIALDAGWDDGHPLTFLAHLRKRMENANRAYTSVQVHCFEWSEEEVLRFSQEEALLAPQFAKSLWGRLQQSPMQMTSYFLGAHHLNGILEGERARLGEEFDIRRFNDAILQAGPVPFAFMPEILAAG